MTATPHNPGLLLHPQIPKPLHLVNPRSILGQGWWDSERRTAYHRAGYKCQACGVPKSSAQYHQWLEAHEIYRIDYLAGWAEFTGLVALCHACHNFIHQGRMQNLAATGKFDNAKRLAILARGRDLLSRAGIDWTLKDQAPDIIAPWGDWRLILFGREYPGKFSTYADWCRHFGHHVPSPRLIFWNLDADANDGPDEDFGFSEMDWGNR